MNNKSKIRQEMLSRRSSLSETDVNSYSASICDQLWKIVESKQKPVIHSYIPMGKEVDVFPLLDQCIQSNYTVVSSKTLKRPSLLHLELQNIDALEDGKFGTKYPSCDNKYEGDYDIIIVPGLAFDSQGYRIGYGAGYYDCFLNEYPNALKIGVAYPFQMIDSVPTENHDVQLDQVIVGG